jgi:hypothetical protein
VSFVPVMTVIVLVLMVLVIPVVPVSPVPVILGIPFVLVKKVVPAVTLVLWF